MTAGDIRERYLKYMEAQGHRTIPSASLVPENDPTTLFTGSGMQPLIPYLMGENHPVGTRLTNSQKCFRAEDIEEVGDNRHTTFFEMLGNWSLGDYFKDEQLSWFYEFLLEEIGLDPQNIYVTVFRGDATAGLPKDDTSVEIWKKLFEARGVSNGVADMVSEGEAGLRGMHEDERIFFYDATKNWWSRAGTPQHMPEGEIGGPDSEVFFDFKTEHDPSFGAHCHPNCNCGRFLEIGNSVFMEYIKSADGSFQRLPKQNVDFGGGLERIVAAAANNPDIFAIDVFGPMKKQLEDTLGTTYDDNPHACRVILDHMRAAIFLLGDHVRPSNKEQGYFVRRLIRRSVLKAHALNEEKEFDLSSLALIVSSVYSDQYPSLHEQQKEIEEAISNEEDQFKKTLKRGIQEAEKRITADAKTHGYVTGTTTATLFTTYGFPLELTEELAGEMGTKVDVAEYKAEMEKHQEQSRVGAEKKFKGGLANHSEQVISYHTATHLLLAALRKYLGEHVHQSGSNITEERLRFDFSHPEKVDEETLRKVEAYVNTAIKNKVSVHIETMDKKDAQADPTVEGSFWDKYPDQVKVYTIKDAEGAIYSRELCGGPHVTNTSELAGTFKILKEESSARGVRRIKAVLK